MFILMGMRNSVIKCKQIYLPDGICYLYNAKTSGPNMLRVNEIENE